MKILENVKNWIAPSRQTIDLADYVEVGRPGEKPLVTNLEEHGCVVTDLEGTEWRLKRAGEVMYLSGEDGEVQAQFDREELLGFLDDAECLALE